MFKNYFKIAIRGLMKNPLTSFINLFGLSVAVGISVLVYAFARWTVETDQFHAHKNEVFWVTCMTNRDGAEHQYGRSPQPLGAMLQQDFAQVKKMCRVEDRSVILKQGYHVFNEKVHFTDAAFLEMFTFPLKWGVSTSLSDVNSIILSEKMSIKYFGTENPIGQRMRMIFGKDQSKEFKVEGVAADFPESCSFSFDFLINYDNLPTADPASVPEDWKSFVHATLVQVDQPSDIKLMEQGMEKYRILQNSAVKKDWVIASFAFEPLATAHKRSENIREGIFYSSADNYSAIGFLVFIGIFMLALACFNYINIAIISASKRLKEIGVRKTIGASKKVIIFQFLSENFLMTFFALLLGVVLGTAIFVPWFEQNSHFSTGFQLADKNLWLYLSVILFLTGIASGIYPAYYVSRFQVIGILKGSVRFGKKNGLTKLLLGVQLILACILITCGVMFTRNTSYLAQRSWGYNQAETMYVEVPDYLSFNQLKTQLAQNPDVVSIAGSGHHLGKSNTTTILHLPDRDYEVDQLSVDARYMETMGLQLTAGRMFYDTDGSDRQSVVVNEQLVKNMAWESPIGQWFKIDSTRFEVVGVLKDFHSYRFSEHIPPTIFRVVGSENYQYLSLQTRKGTSLKTYQALQAAWAGLFPEMPFKGGHQDAVWGNYFESIGAHGRFWRGIALITVLLAGLGLYGLISLNVAGRTKEFSIRKVLGADLKHILTNITRQFVLLFVIALAIGAPTSFVLINLIFDFAYAYHVPVTYSGVALAVAILILVLLVTVATQIRKVIHFNPVDGLKIE